MFVSVVEFILGWPADEEGQASICSHCGEFMIAKYYWGNHRVVFYYIVVVNKRITITLSYQYCCSAQFLSLNIMH